MFVYYARLRDRYQRPVVSLGILTDRRRRWRPAVYRDTLWGCALSWRYPVIKLLDYRGREAELSAHPNPFAVVVLAHLKAQETARDPQARYQWKWQLTRGLYDRGLTRQDIVELFRFIDWVLVLPEDAEDRLWTDLQQYEEQQVMRYVTSVERIGIKKGLQQGLQQGEVRVLRRQLARRFGELPGWVENLLQEAPVERLELWSERLLDANCLEEVFNIVFQQIIRTSK
jgi:hypothetical protein